MNNLLCRLTMLICMVGISVATWAEEHSVSFGISGVTTIFTGVNSRGGSRGATFLDADDVKVDFYSDPDDTENKNYINFDSTNKGLRIRTNCYFTISSPYDDVKIVKVVVSQVQGKTFRELKSGTTASDLSEDNITNEEAKKTSTYTSESGVRSVTIGTTNGNTYIEKIEVFYITSTEMASVEYTKVAATSTTNTAYKMTFTSNASIRSGVENNHLPGIGITFGSSDDVWETQDIKAGSSETLRISNAATVSGNTGRIVGFTNNIPTSGNFIKLTPKVNGRITLSSYNWNNTGVALQDLSKAIGNRETRGTSDGNGAVSYEFLLTGGHTYYLYSRNTDNETFQLYVNSITFEPSYTLYDRGTSKNNAIVTTGSGGYTLSQPTIGEAFDFPIINSQSSEGYTTSASGYSTEESEGVLPIVVNANGEVTMVKGTSLNITVTCTIPTTDKIVETDDLVYIIPGVQDNEKIYMVGAVPAVGQKVLPTDEDGVEGITLTFGGWTNGWSGGSIAGLSDADKTATDYKYKGGATISLDRWNELKTDDAGKDDDGNRTYTIDGFLSSSSGRNDAKSEVFANTDDVTNGHYVAGNKNSIPCRGAYVYFEPTKNGQLTVYILQNGAINTFSDNANASTANEVGWTGGKGDLTGVISWRPFYIVDESGTAVEAHTKDGSNDYVYSNKSVTWNATKFNEAVGSKTPHYDFLYHGDDTNRDDMSNTDNAGDVALITKALESAKSQTYVTPFRTADGGYMVLEKAYVKYTFDVKVGKTYYLFSNFSKLGLCGFKFEASDSQASGDYAVVNKADTGTGYAAGTPGTSYATATFTGRTFAEDTWTTLCLPFSVSAAQMRAAFGDKVQLIEFDNVKLKSDGSSRNTAYFVNHVYNQTVAAGVPYVLKPSALNQKDANGNVYIKDGVYYTDVVAGSVKSEDHGGNDNFVWTGTYENVATLTDGDHFINGKMYYYASSEKHNSNCFRAYLKQNSTSSAKSYIMDVEFGEPVDQSEITAIEVINAAQELAKSLNCGQGVYNINGQKISNDTSAMSSLPAGIYVVDGKKVVIK